MANDFSNNYLVDASGNWRSGMLSNARKTHARKRRKEMRVDIAAAGKAINDTTVLGTFKSSDQIVELMLSTSVATPTTGAISLGLYRAGLDHAPATAKIIDVDLFASAVAITTVLARVDVFKESTTLLDFHRGLTLWELADLGGGTYTEDPMEDWDLVATYTTAVDNVQGLLVECEMVSFG